VLYRLLTFDPHPTYNNEFRTLLPIPMIIINDICQDDEIPVVLWLEDGAEDASANHAFFQDGTHCSSRQHRILQCHKSFHRSQPMFWLQRMEHAIFHLECVRCKDRRSSTPGPHLKSRMFKTNHMPCNSCYSYHDSFKSSYPFYFHSTLPCQLWHHSLVPLFSHNCLAHPSPRTLAVFSIYSTCTFSYRGAYSEQLSRAVKAASKANPIPSFPLQLQPKASVLVSIKFSLLYLFMLYTNTSLTMLICLQFPVELIPSLTQMKQMTGQEHQDWWIENF